MDDDEVSTYVTLIVPQGSENGIMINDQLFVNLGWQSIPGSDPAMVTTFVTLATGKHPPSPLSLLFPPPSLRFERLYFDVVIGNLYN